MLTKVVRIEVEAPYKLRLEFSDGTSGVYDCESIVGSSGPMVQPLKDPKYFARVFVEMGAPTWPNGFDLAPWAIQKELADAGRLRLQAPAIEASKHAKDPKPGLYSKRDAATGKFLDTKASVGVPFRGVRKDKNETGAPKDTKRIRKTK